MHVLRTPVLGVLSDAVCPPSRQNCREHVLGGSVEPVCGDLPGKLAARTFRANWRREPGGELVGNLAREVAMCAERSPHASGLVAATLLW